MKRGIKHYTHPGEILREDVINACNLSIAKASELLKVTLPTLSNILNAKAGISANMAIRISKVFGGNPDLWLKLQTKYDLKQAEIEFEKKPIELQKFDW